MTNRMILAAALAALPLAAPAATFDIAFTGTVTQTNDGAIPLNEVPNIGALNPGDAVSGALTLDTALFGSGAATGLTFHAGAVSNMSLTIDGFTYTAATGTAQVANDYSAGPSAPLRDFFSASSSGASGPSQGGDDPSGFGFALGGTDTSILSDTGPVTRDQLLALFAADTFTTYSTLTFVSRADVRYDVTSVTVTERGATVVPLPAGLPLLMGGLAALGLVRRRRT